MHSLATRPASYHLQTSPDRSSLQGGGIRKPEDKSTVDKDHEYVPCQREMESQLQESAPADLGSQVLRVGVKAYGPSKICLLLGSGVSPGDVGAETRSTPTAKHSTHPSMPRQT